MFNFVIHLIEIINSYLSYVQQCGQKVRKYFSVQVNRSDLATEVTDADIQQFCEQCHGLISATFKTSCKTNEGVKEMFEEIARSLVENNRSRLELQALEAHGFKVHPPEENVDSCSC